MFTTGDNEATRPGGTESCTEIERPRLIGSTGLAAARRFPSTHGAEHLHGTDDLFHTDDIPALDHPVLGDNPNDKRDH